MTKRKPENRHRPQPVRDFTRHNQVGFSGAHIRAFQNPIAFPVDPWCGCCIVYAPDISHDINKPMVLKYHNGLCKMGH